MSVTISIRVKRELVSIADKMVKYGLARSRSHAFNIMIERGLHEVIEKVAVWEDAYNKADELISKGFELRDGKLNEMLEEGRNL